MNEASFSVPGAMRVGGNTSLAGSVAIGHDLKVDGWLDAPNVRTPCKGLFPTLTDLEKACQQPRPGWWALVGTSVPADIYICQQGKWTYSGGQGGNISVEMPAENLSSLSDAISQLATAQQQLTNTVSTIEANLGEIPAQLESLSSVHDQLSADLAAEAETRQTNDLLIQSQINNHPEADGCAEFSMAIDHANIEQQSSAHSSTDPGCTVVYLRQHGTFVLCVETSNGILSSARYYSNWPDRALWGANSMVGAVPQRGRLYYCQQDKKLYRLDRDNAFSLLDLDYCHAAEEGEQPAPTPTPSQPAQTDEWQTIDLFKRLYDATETQGYVMQLSQNAPKGNPRHPVFTEVIDITNCQNGVPYHAASDISQQISKVVWIAPGKTNLDYLCYGLNGVEDLLAAEDYITANATSMAYAFCGCSALKSLDLSSWDASQVTNMSHIFSQCSSLESISFGYRWDTRDVANMTGAFEGCAQLEMLDLSLWNTAAVTRCSGMFDGATNLRYIRVGANLFATRQALPLNAPALGFDAEGQDNGWISHLAETAPTITDGYARIIVLSTALKEAEWAQSWLEMLRQKGYAIG